MIAGEVEVAFAIDGPGEADAQERAPAARTVGRGVATRPPVIPLSSVAASIAGALLAGVIAGVYPSIGAARLMPTQALAAT